jgi:adenine-specific DNA-methyltransferase
MRSQLTRAAVSVPANIAEGQARHTRGEFLQSLSVARGSLAELETLLTLCGSLKLLSHERVQSASSDCEEVGKLLTGLVKISASLTPPLSTIHYSQVTIYGFDYYNTKTGGIESGGEDKITVWPLDTDYDGRSLYPRQVFFSMAGENEGWARLAKNLKAEIDEELIEAYRGTVSLPFAPGQHKRIAIKIVDDRGIESLKVMEIEG